MQTSDFDYHLPTEYIAQLSVEPRDASKLLVLERETSNIDHRSFFNIGSYLKPGDLLVFNQSKVFRARLQGKKHGRAGSGSAGESVNVEVFLLRCEKSDESSSYWRALVAPGRRCSAGVNIVLEEDVVVSVHEKNNDDGTSVLLFPFNKTEVLDFVSRFGSIPIPPYIERKLEKLEEYQTVYAKETGSVAAPTAGFHFTQRLLGELREKGIEFAFLTLHVGLGTFQPVKTDRFEDHKMHKEFVEVSEKTADQIRVAKKEGRRVIAVGTTSVRALEGVWKKQGEVCRFVGDVDLFILPGFSFHVVDAMITNFHLPKSTLLSLVSAFASKEDIFHAYEVAIQNKYRFFSFGDAMFIH